ncbi:unnamed protein product [Porites lobata]|uniref:Secreted protein n=1 Tax=Porites lobata TaxID=104759 RepID=A0ABN8MZ77_9CNID|nr:unnamed protein product [Porites lobata]
MTAKLRVVFSFICVFLLTSPLHVLSSSRSPWGCAFNYNCGRKRQVMDQFKLPETRQLDDQQRPLRESLSKPFEGRLATARRLRTRQELEA